MTKSHVPAEAFGIGDPVAVPSPNPWLATSIWTAWVKPALLWERAMEPAPPLDASADAVTPATIRNGAFAPEQHVAMLVDVDGALAVRLGVALALLGRRPVLSINTIIFGLQLLFLSPNLDK